MALILGEIQEMPEPTPEDLLAEAKSWGFNSWEEYCLALEEAEKDAEYE